MNDQAASEILRLSLLSQRELLPQNFLPSSSIHPSHSFLPPSSNLPIPSDVRSSPSLLTLSTSHHSSSFSSFKRVLLLSTGEEGAALFKMIRNDSYFCDNLHTNSYGGEFLVSPVSIYGKRVFFKIKDVDGLKGK